MKESNLTDRAVNIILTCKNAEIATLTGVKIAGILDANASYLLRKFKKDQNISLPSFILREKMHRAAFILESDNKIPIEELASRLGFPKTRRFIEEFSRYFAITPIRYRELKIDS